MRFPSFLLICWFLFCAGLHAFSQNAKTPAAPASRADTLQVHSIVDEMPKYPGGEKELIKYLRTEVKYPKKALKKGVEGIVFISFVVGRDGAIKNLQVLKSLGSGCDEEAVRLIKSMPKWTPGKKGNTPVDVQFYLPVRFKLPKATSEK